MGSDEEQDGYEVERILEAKVSKKPGKKGKLFWEFLVRWKGYDSDDDTWEPIKCFNTTEIIQEFWDRTKESRDVFDIDQFKVGEKFLPKGPPSRKLKKKSEVHAETSQQGAQSSAAPAPIPPTPAREDPLLLDLSDLPAGTKRRRGVLESTPKQPPSKKSRGDAPGTTSTRKSARNSTRRDQLQSASKSRREARQETPEFVPDSDEEMEMEHDDVNTRDSSRSAQEVASKLEFAPPSPPATNSPAEKADSLFDEEEDIPAHRRRQQKPLVKPFEDPDLQIREGQLASKAKAIARNPPETDSKPSVSKSRPGPGRSSSGMVRKPTLLTASKGTLTSVRASTRRKSNPKPEAEELDPTSPTIGESLVTPEPQEPPTGKELLSMAGLDVQDAEALPDFEEEPERASPTAQERAESLKKAQESLFPNPVAEVDVADKSWSSSTIFGMLTSGMRSSPSLPTEGDANQPNTQEFTLVLDGRTSVPVLFTDASGGRLLPEYTPSASLNNPGKFYSGDVALSLLNALRSSGIAGRVVVRSDASVDLKTHFQRFSQRLQNGELLIATLGFDLFAFCSSDSKLLCSRMNISPGLQVAERQVIVSKVSVENGSDYFKVLELADSRQWSDYVASLS